MINLSKIGERVKEVRKNLGLSQQSFAALIYKIEDWEGGNLSTAISKVESGQQLPTFKMLSGLGELIVDRDKKSMGISADYILFGHTDQLVSRISELPIRRNGILCPRFFSECVEVAASFPEDLQYDDTASYSESAYRLRKIRQSMGLNQGSFGIDKSCVSRNERAVNLLNVRYLIHFCDQLHVPADYILFGTYPSLPYPLQPLLLDRTYQVQQEMLAKFIEIGENVFQN